MSKQYPLLFVQRFKGRILFNEPMRNHTSFRIGGPADVMAFPLDEGDLAELLKFARAKKFPVCIIGAGTNVLVRDGGVRGVVVNMMDGFRDMAWSDAPAGERGRTVLVAGSGVKLQEIAAAARERGLTGLEFSAGIPGTIGGAVATNAGAYGSEIKDIVDGVELVRLSGRKIAKEFIPAGELGFSYRSARIPDDAVIVRVHMTLEKGDPERIRERMAAFAERRRSSAPVRHPCAGSIFKNPPGDHAGRLIEEAGLKGTASGGARIWEVHANYIINTGGALARDVLSLMAMARDRVYRNSGVVLEPEIRVIGEDD
ncbi:MAG TPA: UDP-N-acetylmuramate dehydrogenase [Deltaproteobacteria bacterium]|nr:UDP-N-acetylmuramate dehydrogenase [Deltaproteobacteria bacterium]